MILRHVSPVCHLIFIVKKETRCSAMELGAQVLQNALRFPHQHAYIYVEVNLCSPVHVKSVMIVLWTNRWDVKSMYLTQLGTPGTKIKLTVLTSSRRAAGCIWLNRSILNTKSVSRVLPVVVREISSHNLWLLQSLEISLPLQQQIDTVWQNVITWVHLQWSGDVF